MRTVIMVGCTLAVPPLTSPPLSPGPHTLRITLNNNDHSLVPGVEPVTVAVTVQ